VPGGGGGLTWALTVPAMRWMAIALGLIVVLLVSGVIEAFVTPSPLPTWARIVIGLAAEAAFLSYVIAFGRRAAAAGLTADVAEVPDVVPVSG
jgi:hypothetical protein